MIFNLNAKKNVLIKLELKQILNKTTMSYQLVNWLIIWLLWCELTEFLRFLLKWTKYFWFKQNKSCEGFNFDIFFLIVMGLFSVPGIFMINHLTYKLNQQFNW